MRISRRLENILFAGALTLSAVAAINMGKQVVDLATYDPENNATSAQTLDQEIRDGIYSVGYFALTMVPFIGISIADSRGMLERTADYRERRRS